MIKSKLDSDWESAEAPNPRRHENKTYNALNTSPSTANEHNNPADQHEPVDRVLPHVLPARLPGPFLAEHEEPHERRQVQGEARVKQARDQGDEVAEEGDGLGDDPPHGDDGEDGEKPCGPAPRGVDIALDAVREDSAVD